MGVEVIGSHVRTSKKLLATQAFCPEKWPAADHYNHLCKWSNQGSSLSASDYSKHHTLKLTISYGYKPSKRGNSKPKYTIKSNKRTEIIFA